MSTTTMTQNINKYNWCTSFDNVNGAWEFSGNMTTSIGKRSNEGGIIFNFLVLIPIKSSTSPTSYPPVRILWKITGGWVLQSVKLLHLPEYFYIIK